MIICVVLSHNMTARSFAAREWLGKGLGFVFPKTA